jgi:hypothetical protein
MLPAASVRSEVKVNRYFLPPPANYKTKFPLNPLLVILELKRGPKHESTIKDINLWHSTSDTFKHATE